MKRRIQMLSFQGGYHSRTRSLIIMQNLSKTRSNSCIHRFIFIILIILFVQKNK
ncbi:unnamed protein product [Brassica oleracea]